MKLNEYQELAMRTKGNMTRNETLLCGGLGISGEAGEVSDIVKKMIFHGHIIDNDKIIKELGDVLWYIALLSEGLGYDLETVAKRNIDKLNKRYPDGFSHEDSINRVEE